MKPLRLPVLLLLLLTSSTAALPTESTGRERFTTPPSEVLTTPPSPQTATVSRFAMLDDVRLLANGLLQLGQSLREFVHKTKGQMNDIFQKLNIFDRSFDHLSVVTSEIREKEEELKKTTNFLKANNEEIKNLSLEINYKINGIMQERTQLQSKVGSLEEKLRGLSQSMVPADQLSEISTLKVSCASRAEAGQHGEVEKNADVKMRALQFGPNMHLHVLIMKNSPSATLIVFQMKTFAKIKTYFSMNDFRFVFLGLELRRIRLSLLPNNSLLYQRHYA